MPISYVRRLTGSERSQQSNRHLALVLAFVAGSINAGGYLAVRQYTSHMSGIVSSIADNLALGDVGLMLAGLGALLAFLAGAACTALLVNWGRRRHLHSEYAFPLMLESALLICFGLMSGYLEHRQWLFVSSVTLLLCFTMGLQNAIITKISHAEIRTTHVTGIVTDIGIELGKLAYWNRSPGQRVTADWQKLRLLSSLFGLFLFGGLVGALGFKHLGFLSALPLALVLFALAAIPVVDDLREVRVSAH
ncbi:YoaK family protein [soil metagenome]